MDAWECSYSICAKRFHSAYFRKIDCIFQVGAYAGIEEEQSEFSKGKAIQLHKKYPFTSENTAVTLIMLKRFNSNPYGGVCMTDSLVFFFLYSNQHMLYICIFISNFCRPLLETEDRVSSNNSGHFWTFSQHCNSWETFSEILYNLDFGVL